MVIMSLLGPASLQSIWHDVQMAFETYESFANITWEEGEDLAKLRIIPLGGIGEIGKNMTAFEYGDDVIVVDCGSIFPRQDMLGIDLVIPDIAYLINNRERVRAYLFTHGHEDHIGAVPYVFPRVPAPAYGTKLTCALIRGKMAEHNISGIQLNVVKPRDTVQIGAFTVQFIKVSHSIAGAVAMAITCPAGTVIVTGDFKIDYTPIDGEVTDLGTLAAWGNQGVLALLADSTNVERPGYTMSEKKIAETFRGLFKDADKRIIIAMFASNLHRIQQVVDLCVEFGRKICFVGRSMVNVTKLAMDIGEIKIPREVLVEAGDLDCYDDDEIVVLTTGSQGEPMSGLSRMAFSEHKKLEIRPTDMVIISATPIPGNEKSVSRVINQLVRTGADVIYEALAEVHVSGHARQEELKLIHALTKPKFFIPVHGEYRHLYHHANLAISMGMPPENVMIPDTGTVIELTPDEMRATETVPSGAVLIDGLGIGDVGEAVLRDRKHLAEDGLIIVVIGLDHETGALASGPDIVSRGFVYVKENEDIMDGARATVQRVLETRLDQVNSTGALKDAIREALSRYIYDTIRRNPMILTIIV